MESRVITSLRQKLEAANILMSYDYAWKESEFLSSPSRMSGVVCRLLYLMTIWRLKARCYAKSEEEAIVQESAFVESNKFEAFQEHVIRACDLMNVRVTKILEDASFVFLYIAPPNEKRVEDQHKVLQQLCWTGENDAKTSKSQHDPLLCLLLGDCELLPAPTSDEEERCRGLVELALSQELSSHPQYKMYSTMAEFTAEYSPQKQSNASADASGLSQKKHDDLKSLIGRFGCSPNNLMQHFEKWKIMAPSASKLGLFLERCHGEGTLLSDPQEDAYWENAMKEKACAQCHRLQASLFRCAQCKDTMYCSKDCQKKAWKTHKKICAPAKPV